MSESGKNSKDLLRNFGKDKVFQLRGADYMYSMMPSLKKALGINNQNSKENGKHKNT